MVRQMTHRIDQSSASRLASGIEQRDEAAIDSLAKVAETQATIAASLAEVTDMVKQLQAKLPEMPLTLNDKANMDLRSWHLGPHGPDSQSHSQRIFGDLSPDRPAHSPATDMELMVQDPRSGMREVFELCSSMIEDECPKLWDLSLDATEALGRSVYAPLDALSPYVVEELVTVEACLRYAQTGHYSPHPGIPPIYSHRDVMVLAYKWGMFELAEIASLEFRKAAAELAQDELSLLADILVCAYGRCVRGTDMPTSLKVVIGKAAALRGHEMILEPQSMAVLLQLSVVHTILLANDLALKLETLEALEGPDSGLDC
ncbi:hypothetical protein LTR53_014814 [Teratosphaeriaceae sp. CCFEE 6253]|nr:hypothetical protein LTR53_014814 [Teratosphaeriaceae sp. CCFEE 6253]